MHPQSESPSPVQFSYSSHARQSHESNFSVYTKAPFRSMCCDCDLPPSVARIVGGCSSGSNSNSNSSKQQAAGNIWLQNSFTATRQEAASIVACLLYKASWKGQKPVQTPPADSWSVPASLLLHASLPSAVPLSVAPHMCCLCKQCKLR